MGGDYSRERFDAKNDFHGILQQQGRVHLDANWNELVKIVDRRSRAETTDIIGRCAVPRETPDGFLIRIAGNNLTIGCGRAYIDGLLAENHGKAPLEFDRILAEERGTAAVPYDEQPYFPNAANTVPREGGPHLVYLDVCEREVTYLQRPDLIEQAIGVDTVTALQTIWQVKVLPNLRGNVTCATPNEQIPGWSELTRPSAGRLSTKVVNAPDNKDPCLIPPGNGFRALENQLYRIEIHNGGALGTATFKCSRDNGCVATNVIAIGGTELTVARTGRDAILRFNPGDWVEITYDGRELDGKPGEIRKVKNVVDATQIIELNSPLPPADFPTDPQHKVDPNRHTRIRRWDQKGKVLDANGNLIVDLDAGGSSGVIPVPATGTSIVLDSGVQVTFSLDPAGGQFKSGDYWTFAARPVDGTIEVLDKAPPRGVHHHYCRLAIVNFTTNAVADCRTLWPTMTERPDTPAGRGIRVKSVNLIDVTDRRLENDTEVSVNALAQGIRVICDGALAKEPFGEAPRGRSDRIPAKPTCLVTLDLPYPLGGEREIWAFREIVGFQPLILGSGVSVQENEISWRPTGAARHWLQDVLFRTLLPLEIDQVLAHLTVKGNFIWSAESRDEPILYLDGEAFGRPRNGRVDLDFPSGDGQKGGDLEMWFWLVLEERRIPIELTSITVNPVVVAAGVSSRGTVTLSGPAPAGGAVIALSGNNPVATVPGGVTISEGNTTASFEISTNQARESAEVVITASFAGVSRSAALTVRSEARLPLLKVARVGILDVSDVPDRPNVAPLVEMESPRVALRVDRGRPNAIEVQFSETSVNFESVVSGKTFLVLNEEAPERPVPGQIVRFPATNAVRWVTTPPQPLRPGRYRVILKGEGEVAIMSREGLRLDGEPAQLPSGDDVEGRDFFFGLVVTS